MVFTVDLLKFCYGYSLIYLAWFSMKKTKYKCEKSQMIFLNALRKLLIENLFRVFLILHYSVFLKTK